MKSEEYYKNYRKQYRIKNRDYLCQWKREYYQRNKEKIKAKTKLYYKNNKSIISEKTKIYASKNKDKIRIRQNKYRDKYRLKLIKYKKEYRQKNKEKIYQMNLKWKKENPDKYKFMYYKRRGRIKNIIHDFTMNDWKNKLKNSDGYCNICNKYFGINKLEMDHIYPISKAVKGQIYTIDDVQPLYRKCNCEKYNKIINKNSGIMIPIGACHNT